MRLNPLARITLALVATAVLGACSSPSAPAPTTATAPPTNSATWAIITKAPHAYTGVCEVQWQDGRWRQANLPGASNAAYVADGSTPVPCANLTASIGTTGASANPPLQRYAQTQTIGNDGRHADTDRIWIKTEQQPNGDWLITWGVKPGVRVEWFATFDGPDHVAASDGRFVWHSASPQLSYPAFSVYANDLDAGPGSYIPVTGPLVPNP